MSELDAIKFSIASIIELTTNSGSYERRIACDASDGIKAKLDYVLDSLEENHAKLTAAAVAGKLGSPEQVQGAIAGSNSQLGSQWTPSQIARALLQKDQELKLKNALLPKVFL